MAIGLLFELPGVTQEQYDAVMKRLNLGGKLPQGALAHVAGPVEGGWRVIDAWESRQAFDRFFDEKLRDAIQGVGGMPPIEPKEFPVHNTLR